MKYKVVPVDLKVKAVTTIDFPIFYKRLKLWLQDEGYAKEESLETKYIQRTKPGGKQLEIQWKTKKSKSDFFDYHINLTFLILRMNTVEVQQSSVTRNMDNADFELRIESYIETTENLEKLGTLKRIYTNLLIKKRIEEYKIELYDKVYQFHAYVKELLSLRNY